MRDLSPEFLAAIRADSVVPALLVYLDFAGDPFRAWTGLGPVEGLGHTWQGVGNLGEVGGIEEYSEIRAGTVELRLSRIPGTALADAFTLTYKRRAAEIHLVLLDEESDAPAVLHSALLFRGSMDTLELDRQPGESSFTLVLANELARLKDSWGLLYTDSDQQRLFPGDTSLRFVPSLQDKKVRL
ncbi:hypothetical protein OJ996_20570 [Luteolibacter sp. GHJ8]|uniref:Uncharacterized protein n=1 Tax=Luteolibacter rhizosphaerae TaxID=2989719 RepID=A0ABT3G816_9BACT|nr:hypothetical protein [Luteolibacter rhizosphaerae]MCW1915994.1 hypothetical protein [Luteolibacter rhizosphaerae]